MRTLLTIITTLCCAPKGTLGGAAGQPTRVQLSSQNMDLVLHWEPPHNTSQLNYTTELRSSVGEYLPGCANNSVLYCDFTTLVGLPLTAYGTYIGRVRAQRGQESSVWVESRPLSLDVNSPPSVTLVSNGVHMTINIRDPEFRISTLSETYHGIIYNVTYWREGEEDKHLSENHPGVVLNDLEPQSRYCVKVQIRTHANPRPSLESNVVCEKTTDQDRTPWLEALVILVVMAMVVTIVAVLVVHRKKISNFLCPNDSLPQHFTDIFESSSLVSTMNYRPPVENYDKVNIMTTENTDEDRPPVVE
ncbi:hypothetical protein CRUP_008941 [Coryphaenoides rupestris]|nr:hypothetical protein CRUP_008941 [Coryphaenoides rupestris]